MEQIAKKGKIKFTHRESQCLALLLYGKTTKEIADILCLSPRTIGFYVNNIKQKAGLNKKAILLKELKTDQFKEKYELTGNPFFLAQEEISQR